MNARDFGSQLLTYHTIRIYIEMHGYPPTKEEIAAARRMHVTNVYKHLKQLEERGYITKERGWRNIRLGRAA